MNDCLFLGTKCIGVYPSPEGNIFICNAEAKRNEQIFFEAGEGASLDLAKKDAYENLQKLIGGRAKILPDVSQNNQCKDDLKGGGNKAASSAQLDFLHKLAVTVGISLGAFIDKEFQKNIPQLLGFEADKAIKSLMAKIENSNIERRENDFF